MTYTETDNLLIKNRSTMRKDGGQNTKIVATVGPACSSYDKLLELVKAGVDVFRLNFSHGTHADHLEVIQHIRTINAEYNTYIGILADRYKSNLSQQARKPPYCSLRSSH